MATEPNVPRPQLARGGWPEPAAPMARPVNAASEMGVPRTRCGPNSLTRGAGASVARWSVRGSRRISSSMASIPAAAYEICRIAWLLLEGLLALGYWLLARLIAIFTRMYP